MKRDNVLTVPSSTRPGDPAAERVAKEQPVSIATPAELVSILIPCCGQLEYTKPCLPALLRHTRPPFELIFLGIGSLDGFARQ